MSQSNLKFQNALLNNADLSDLYSDDLIDAEDEAEAYYGPSRVKTKKRVWRE